MFNELCPCPRGFRPLEPLDTHRPSSINVNYYHFTLTFENKIRRVRLWSRRHPCFR